MELSKDVLELLVPLLAQKQSLAAPGRDSETRTVSGTREFTVEELLRKKKKAEVSTPAQKYFSVSYYSNAREGLVENGRVHTSCAQSGTLELCAVIHVRKLHYR